MDEYIRKALLELLKEKEYENIQMKEIAERANIGRRTLYRYFKNKDEIVNSIIDDLMDEFANQVNLNGKRGTKNISNVYFKFWLEHEEILSLLQKAHLTWMIEEQLPELMMKVALKTKFKGMGIVFEKAIKTVGKKQLYSFYYMWAGIWKLTIIWFNENPRKSPEEMSEIIYEIIEKKE